MLVKLLILDEVNCRLEGLFSDHLNLIIESTKFTVQGSFHSAACKLGLWDGKESFIDSDGNTFLFFLNRVLPLVVEYGYEVRIEDHRNLPTKKPEHIKNTLFHQYDLTMLRDYQVDSANTVIDNEKGLIDIATSGGKTLICAALATIYNNIYRTLVIVPNENLVTQTYKIFCNVGLEVGKISGKTKDKEKEWCKRHIVCTWQTLNRNRQHLSKFHVVLYDEIHVIGDTMFDALKNDLSHAPIRVGFTGTVPKDKHKREKIMCHIGGDILYKVTPKQLQDAGYISTCDITIVPIDHHITLPDEEWDTEMKYLNANKHRLNTITDFITEILKASPENTLILTHPQFGNKLSTLLDTDFIDDGVDSTLRDTFYQKFNETSNYVLTATFGTVGTGISIDHIRRLIMIDAGKNDTRIMQGIGRGLRLDGGDNHLQVFDFYSRLFKQNAEERDIMYGYGCMSHLKDRKKIYKENKYPYTELEGIKVYDASSSRIKNI